MLRFVQLIVYRFHVLWYYFTYVLIFILASKSTPIAFFHYYHYSSQVVAAGLRLTLSKGELLETNPLVWGYRNVWFEFEPSDATLMIPVSAPDLDFMHNVFMACFTTQKAASFPSPYYDGPFSSWAVQILQKQKKLLTTLLGAEYFATHLNERVRNSDGFVFIKAMYAEKFLQEVEQLQSKIENKKD